jgi:hypothetical protein
MVERGRKVEHEPVERVKLRCKMCGKRGWFYPKVVVRKQGRRHVKMFRIRCRKCMAAGEFQYHGHAAGVGKRDATNIPLQLPARTPSHRRAP